MYCYKCGAENPDSAAFCTSCGTSLKEETQGQNGYTSYTHQQQAQVAPTVGTVKSGNSKKIIIIIISIVAVLAIAIIGAIIYKTNDDKRKAEEAAAIAAQQEEDYKNNLKTLSGDILSSAAEVETAGNLVVEVWNNAIWKKSSTSTDKYARPNGVFVDDFNDALHSLYADESFKSKISGIISEQYKIKEQMKQMVDPPSKYSSEYSALKAYYEEYNAFADMVLNPTGSLKTFSEGFSKADSDLMKAYKALELYLD